MNEGRKAVEYILGRHSVREFESGAIPPEDVELMKETLRWAPSAGNMQPWFFYVVAGREAKEGLAAAAYGQQFVAEAPVAFVVCAEPERSAARYGERGRTLYCYQDTAAAVENLLLAGHMLGYGACWVGAFDEVAARDALDIPKHLRPVAIVPVGRCRPVTRFPDRRPAKTLFKLVE
jgi:nitroreductase